MNRARSTPLLLGLLALLAGCPGLPEGPKTTPKARTPVTFTDRLPKRTELACFPCHSQVKFEKGPFPHKKIAHKNAGHCHVCHLGPSHEGRTIDRAACLTCHEEDSEELQVLSSGLSKDGTQGK